MYKIISIFVIMNNKLIVYTCVTGGYDTVSRPSALPEWADFICFGQDIPVTWQAKDNTQLARYAKLNPHIVLPEGYEYSLWIDGNIDIVDPGFFSKVREMMSAGILIAGLYHPQRDDVYEESLRILKNDRESFGKLMKVVKFLRKEGLPEHYGLDETNVILRKHDNHEVRKFDGLWWEMLRTWTNRDQMTQSYCFWKTGLPHDHLLPQGQCAQNHPWFKYTFHGKTYIKDRSLHGRMKDACRALKVLAYRKFMSIK